MKICYLADINSTHAQRIVKHFAHQGHEVHVLSINQPSSYRSGYDTKFQIHFIGPFRSGPKFSPKFLSNQMKILKRIKDTLKSLRPGVLHSLFITDCGFYGALSGYHPFVVFAMGSDIFIHPNRNLIYRAMYKFVLNRADIIHCETEHAKQTLYRNGCQLSKLKAFPIGVDLSLFKKQELNPEYLRSIGLDIANKIVISTRSLSKPLYSVETLILAAPYVIDKHPEARFAVVGDGPVKKVLKALARDLRVNEFISFVGYVPNSEVPKLLNHADIYVSTSLSDTFSICTLEAMACSKPVVVTDIPGTNEWLKDGWNGFVFAKRDYRKLADRITALLGNVQLSKKMGERNRHLVEARGSVCTSLEQIHNLYTELLGIRALP